MELLWQDVAYSLRSLRKTPVFTVVALLSIMLGIGANTAIFSLMDQVLLRALPVRHPEELVLFRASDGRPGWISSNYGSDYEFSFPMYRDFRDRLPVFSGVIARVPVVLSMSAPGNTELAYGDLVSGNYFQVLGVRAALGRTFTQDDDRTPGAHPVAILSYGFWQRRFGTDPGVLNRVIQLNGHPMTVVGVAQAGFQGVGVGEAPDVFVPLMMRSEMSPGRRDLEDRRAMWLNVFGRLKPNVSKQQAEAAVNTFWRPILEMEAKNTQDLTPLGRERFLNARVALLPGGHGISSAPPEFSTGVQILMAMVALLLLIACANVASLMIARATARQKEIGIRLALGAGRFRIARQLLSESLIIAVGGGLLGILAAEWIGDALLRTFPDDPAARGLTSQPDSRVLLFALCLSVLTGILFGLVPAFQSSRNGIGTTLKEQASSILGGFPHLRLRKILVVSQVVLSLLLLVAAGVFAKSLFNLKNVHPGFQADHLISFTINPALNGYNAPRRRAVLEQLQENISALPGVRAAGMASVALLAGDRAAASVKVDGYTPKPAEQMAVDLNLVSPGYFAAIRIPVLMGREFTRHDGPEARNVAIVNEAFAQHFFGHDDPIGRRFRVVYEHEESPVEIVGVVRDGKHWSLREKPVKYMYFPYAQRGTDDITCYVRTSQNPASLATVLRQQVQRLDPNLPVFGLKTMDEEINESVFPDRLIAALSLAFGGLATLLAAIGLYGVMAYLVVHRTREIGVRIALGAMPREVLAMVMREVIVLAGIGVIIALACSFASGRVITSQLFGVSGSDPAMIAGATALLAFVAALAGFIPAFRAARIDPLVALRYE